MQIEDSLLDNFLQLTRNRLRISTKKGKEEEEKEVHCYLKRSRSYLKNHKKRKSDRSEFKDRKIK